MTENQRDVFIALIGAILDAVKAAGPMGAPGGHIYAALMGLLTFDQYNAIMAELVRQKRLIKRGQCYLLATQ